MAIREGRWQCACTKENRGPDDHCSGCGRPRPENVVFYLPGNSPVVEDPEKIKEAESGPDWHCSHCSAGNNAWEENCYSCGNERDDSDTEGRVIDYSLSSVPRNHGEAALLSKKRQSRKKKEPYALVSNSTTYTSRSKSNFVKRFLQFSLFLLGIFLVYFFFFASEEILVKVVDHSWERGINIQKERTLVDDGWDIPYGGREISNKKALHHKDKVLDYYKTKTRKKSKQVPDGKKVCGHRDLKNGYFEDIYCTKFKTVEYEEEYEDPVYKYVPVYQTRYTYEIDVWQYARTVPSSGKGKVIKPHWPKVKLGKKERESSRDEEYTVHFISLDLEEKQKFSKSFKSMPKWESFDIGYHFILTVKRRGFISNIKLIE